MSRVHAYASVVAMTTVVHHKPRRSDLNRADVIKKANKAIMENGGPKLAKVYFYFKFTCPKCGARCEFEEPNKLYEKGICYAVDAFALSAKWW